MNPSISQKISLDSPIEVLFNSKKSKTLENLKQAGLHTLEDLLWVFPIRIENIPSLGSFSKMQMDSYFKGVGEVKDIQRRNNQRVKGKGGVSLQNITVIVKDYYSDSYLNLKWFNTYPSIVKKIENAPYIGFLGKIQEFNGAPQIVNPDITPLEEEDISSMTKDDKEQLKIQYPTVNKTKSFSLKKLINKIPHDVWEEFHELLDSRTLSDNNFLELKSSFKALHGRDVDFYDSKTLKKAQDRIIFEEFFCEQAKLFLRRKSQKKETSIVLKKFSKNIFSTFPHLFTRDQEKAINEIESDFTSAKPMMRMVQGDVGCGKTWVALASCLHVNESGYQSAFMCPTESLARQHYSEASELFKDKNIVVTLLLGSTKPKEKKEIYEKVASGEIDLLIGTHALIQNDLKFSKLGLAVIDEQHKFGVEQRIKLVSKGTGCHCLIMTATPIPRSLSLTQYGDLDITTIKSIPETRKGYKTRIVDGTNFSQFLSFLKTRLAMNEQAYIVVPAIEDNETLDIHNLEQVQERFKKFFPQNKILPLHGKLSTQEKEQAFIDFKKMEIDILVATSVVEVGINVHNATIMAILNPERFGLSSLHQLRGRVGRGDKAGFCFLILDGKISREAKNRLEFLEKTSDGFLIAEEDLRLRGQGDILGKSQSGTSGIKRFANPIVHYDLLEKARKMVLEMSDSPGREFNTYLKKVSKDNLVHTTI